MANPQRRPGSPGTPIKQEKSTETTGAFPKNPKKSQTLPPTQRIPSNNYGRRNPPGLQPTQKGNTMSTKHTTKLAKTLQKALKEVGLEIPHTKALQITSRLLGENSLHTLQHKLKSPQPQKDPAQKEEVKPQRVKILNEWVKQNKEDHPKEINTQYPIVLQQFLVSVLMEKDKEGNWVLSEDLQELAHVTYQGEGIGAIQKLGEIELKSDEVYGTLLSMGNDGEFFPEAEEIYLTNACGENTCKVSEEDLQHLGLPFDTEEFPLTKKETKHLQETKSFLGYEWLANYTTLYQGKKWHCPTLELIYKDPFWNDETLPSKEECIQTAEEILKKAKAFAKAKGGVALLEQDMPGRVCLRLRLPFTT